jgi:hypothetical protein
VSRPALAGALAAALLAPACVFYVGTSAQTPHGLQDLRYATAPSELLRPGTTREQALCALGVPDRVVDGGRVLLYAAPAVSGQLWVITGGGSGGGMQPLGRSVALAVVFDAAGRYVRHRLEVAGLSEPHAAAQRALLAVAKD